MNERTKKWTNEFFFSTAYCWAKKPNSFDHFLEESLAWKNITTLSGLYVVGELLVIDYFLLLGAPPYNT